jgi:hypothetical protein
MSCTVVTKRDRGVWMVRTSTTPSEPLLSYGGRGKLKSEVDDFSLNEDVTRVAPLDQ